MSTGKNSGKWLAGLFPLAAAAALPASRYMFDYCFKVIREKTLNPYRFPTEEQYRPLKKRMTELMDKAVWLPYEGVYVTSFDGLRLYARYYETDPKAPLVILFHGYRANGYRDFSGALPLAVECGLNVLMVDERAHGKSEGDFLTMGIWEQRDVVSWCQYALERLGSDVKIILSGVSMGAATVLQASGRKDLPSQVVGVIADCGYSSQKEIFVKVMKEGGYPEWLYYLIPLGAKIWGHFDLNATAPKTAVENSKVPILFIHGDDDRFVPYEMSKVNYEHCASEKTFVTIEGAGHAMAYIIDPETYTQAFRTFVQKVAPEFEMNEVKTE